MIEKIAPKVVQWYHHIMTMMKKHSTHLTALLLSAILAIGAWGCPDDKTQQPAGDAYYRVTFEATWSADSHPEDFPAQAHWSGLIGATHNASVTFWDVGSVATAGIKSVAETGGKATLLAEVQAAISDTTAEYSLSGGGINPSPGSVSLEFDISSDFPLVTLVTMIAPSPDWFAGVNGLSLIDGNDWVDELTVELFAFDAGTDDGSTYLSPNASTDPPVVIRLIDDGVFRVNESVPALGTFTFTHLKPLR